MPPLPVPVQLVSDVHLELRSKPSNDAHFATLLRPAAPVLALCGDVGRPGSGALRAFLRWCAARFEVVLLVAGNHERYVAPSLREERAPATEAALVATLRADAALAGPNVCVLERDRVDLNDDVAVLGCTLWSHVPPPFEALVADGVADYVYVWTDDGGRGVRRATVADTNAWHARDVAWLRRQLTDLEDEAAAGGARRRVLVLTHHVPTTSPALVPLACVGQPLNAAFNSDAGEALLAGRGGQAVVAWFAGHSHVAGSAPLTRAGAAVDARVYVNAFGYAGREHDSIRQWSRTAVIGV
jgi:hypothetical protein